MGVGSCRPRISVTKSMILRPRLQIEQSRWEYCINLTVIFSVHALTHVRLHLKMMAARVLYMFYLVVEAVHNMQEHTMQH